MELIDKTADIYQFTILLIFLMAISFFLYMYWYSIVLKKTEYQKDKAKQKLIVKGLKLEKSKAENARLEAETKMKEEKSKRLEQEIILKNKELATTALLVNQHNEVLSNIEEYVKKIRTETTVNKEATKEIRKLIRKSVSITNDWENFKVHFDKVHPHFFKKLMERNTGLSQNDMRHCAYMRMQLSTKEIARLLGINPTSVQMSRVRLKKKLNLGKQDDLRHYIMEV